MPQASSTPRRHRKRKPPHSRATAHTGRLDPQQAALYAVLFSGATLLAAGAIFLRFGDRARRLLAVREPEVCFGVFYYFLSIFTRYPTQHNVLLPHVSTIAAMCMFYNFIITEAIE